MPQHGHRQLCKSPWLLYPKQGTGWSRPGSQPTRTLFFGQDREAAGGIQKWEKEEKEEEEEEAEAVAAAAAAAGASMEEEGLDSLRDLLSLRSKARDEGPAEVKPELHPLENR